MARPVFGAGPSPSPFFLCGERPGWEEARAGRGFVGKAGTELWARLAWADAPDRDAWWVTSLVKTFSTDPPTVEEIRQWELRLISELRRQAPHVVVAAGAYAARWFLGAHFDLRRGHGLGFASTHAPDAIVVPIYHPAAALRQPELYQAAFTADCLAIAAAARNRLSLHTARVPTMPLAVAPSRLAPAGLLGCDTEGAVHAPECVTLSDGVQVSLRRTLTPATRRLLTSRKLTFHNATHDLRALATMGVPLDAVTFDDTMLMAYLLGEHGQGLKALVDRHCGLKLHDYDDLIAPMDADVVKACLLAWLADYLPALQAADALKGKAKAEARRQLPTRAMASVTRLLDATDATKPLRARVMASVFAPLFALPPVPTWKDLPRDVGEPYATTDAFAHRALRRALWPRIQAEGLTAVYKLDRAVLPMVARMEQIGVQVDPTVLTALSATLEVEYHDTCRQIETLLGYPLNPKAAEDVSEALFDDLGVTPTKLTKSGKYYTTQDKYLEARRQEHAVVPLIIRGRELWKLKSSYCDRLPTLLTPTGRYRPDFAYTRTATGRLAETIILLIPKHSAEGKQIRNAFVAGEGHALVSVDLSQIELRMLAHASRDEAMLQVFRDGRDPHAETAHHLFGAPPRREDQDESRHRLPAKKGNFGAFMGLSPQGLTDQVRAGGNVAWAVGCPVCDGDAPPYETHADACDSRLFFREYFTLYTGVKHFIQARHAEACLHGVVRDLWGRKIPTAGIRSTDRRIVGEAERKAQASTIQSGADGISKRWMKRVWDRVILPRQRRGEYCEPWLRVHDDLVIECEWGEAEAVKAELLALVPQVLRIPIEADGKIGQVWGSLK